MNRKTEKRFAALLLSLCMALLSGCSATTANEPATAATLPPPDVPYDAPTNDLTMSRTVTVPLYLPSRDGQRLLARNTDLTLKRGSDNTRTVVQALLNCRNDDRTAALGAGTPLQLYGLNPVEAAGDVCTVNLGASALELAYSDLYTVGLAMAATLEASCGIRYVNLLIADQPVSLDVFGYLPAGSIGSHPGEELQVLWEQMDARRTLPGRSAAQSPLSATATLYFPLYSGEGIISETRNLTFPGQTPAQLTSTLLQALSAGAQYSSNVSMMPDINAMLRQEPLVTEMAEGGRMVTLYFLEGLSDRLSLYGMTTASFAACVNCTLTTFVPGLAAVRMYDGDILLNTVNGAGLGILMFENGVQRRSRFTPALMEYATVCLARNGKLIEVTRAVPYGTATDPRTLMSLLMAGPTAAERQTRYAAVLPEGLDITDLLGLGAEEDTLLINLSPRFERLIRSGELSEQLMCYSMVVTLCEALDLNRVRFFFNGEVQDRLGGSISWNGEFILNRSLVN